jgi:hypothetical protein
MTKTSDYRGNLSNSSSFRWNAKLGIKGESGTSTQNWGTKDGKATTCTKEYLTDILQLKHVM